MPCINDLIEYAKTKNNGITTDDIFSFFEINDKQVTHNEYELLIMQLNNNGIDIVEPEDIDNTTGEIYNINEGAITIDDLSDFSEDLQELMKRFYG